MKVIIAGTRTLWPGMNHIHDLMMRHFNGVSEVVCGGAKGVDSVGETWARTNCVPVKVFKADWDQWGKAAGPLRNRLMASYADALLLIWDGKSRGSAGMKNEMMKRCKPVMEVIL